MVVCCICGIEFGPESECITFHRFPKREDRKVQWLTAIDEKVKNFKFIASLQICSQHFTMECFVVTCSGKRYLKSDAVPTIFHMPLKQGLEIIQPVQQQLYIEKYDNVANTAHKQVYIKAIRLPATIINSNENKDNPYKPSTSSTVSASILKNVTKFSTVHSVLSNTSTINDTEEVTDLQQAKEHIAILKKKLKVSQQKCRRLQTRVTFLKLLAKHLQKKDLCIKKV